MEKWLRQLRKTTRRLRRGFEARLTAVYYRFFFGRPWAFASGLAARVEAWETTPPEAWERQYERGHWAYLHDLNQLARYSVLVGYLHQLKPSAAVLDVGCGEGRLFHLYRPHCYSRYVGLEISSTALAGLIPMQDARTSFVCADAEAYEPTEPFDAIIFNESLYYFREPLAGLARYRSALRPGGIILVSSYAGSARAMAILRSLKAVYPLLDETRVTQGTKSWLCSVFQPASTTS